MLGPTELLIVLPESQGYKQVLLQQCKTLGMCVSRVPVIRHLLRNHSGRSMVDLIPYRSRNNSTIPQVYGNHSDKNMVDFISF